MGAASGSRDAQIRGTQTFVGVMAAVWKRPSLTLMELAWRWPVGIVCMWLAAVVLGSLGVDVHLRDGSFRVAPLLLQLRGQGGQLPLQGTVWAAALALIAVVWIGASAAGRSRLLRRLEPQVEGDAAKLVVAHGVRLAAVAMVWAGWVLLLRGVARHTVWRSAAEGDASEMVVFFGIAIVLTLVLYVGWFAVSWPLQLAPLRAMQTQGRGIAQALRVGPELRSKLIETNLVMSIVKIALLVLLMVFSASPLAFTAVTTPVFLTCWWTVGVLLYFVASDYFHVVRMAAYLALMRAYEAAG